jgi:outer membrane protein
MRLALAAACVLAVPVHGPGAAAAAPDSNLTRAAVQEPGVNPRKMTLREALEQALAANRGLESARSALDAATADKKAALSLVLPKLAVSGNLTRNSEEVAFGFGEDARTILPENDWAYRITLSQPVFAGLRDLRTYDQSKLGVEAARDGVRQSEDGALLAAAEAYLAVVEADGLIEVEQRNLALAERRRAQAQAFLDAGETTRVDLLRAIADIKGVERRLVAARQARVAAEGRLRLALAIESDVEVQEPESAVPPLPDSPTLLARAEAERPEVRRAESGLRIAELEVRKQRGAYLPVLTAEAGYLKQKREFPKDQYAYAALNFNVPLFQGGEVGARVASAQARERQAQLALDQVRQQVREEVRREVLGLEAARTALALSEEQLQAAEAEYNQTFELYRGQEATTLDLQSAEAGLGEARRAVLTSRLVTRLQEMRVWQAAGSLKAAVFMEVVP